MAQTSSSDETSSIQREENLPGLYLKKIKFMQEAKSGVPDRNGKSHDTIPHII